MILEMMMWAAGIFGGDADKTVVPDNSRKG